MLCPLSGSKSEPRKRSERKKFGIFFDFQDGSNTLPRNVIEFLQDYAGFEILTKVLSSGIFRRVVRWNSTKVSEEYIASIFSTILVQYDAV
jgi:hypothetical protein